MQLKIHKATAKDADLLAEFNAQLIADEASRNKMKLPELKKRMRNWLKKKIYQAVIIYHQEIAVGYMMFKISDDEYNQQPRVFIRQYFVKSEHRSRGLGKLAFDQIKAEYFAEDSTLWLEVLESNPRGQAFWSSLGFSTYSRVMCQK